MVSCRPHWAIGAGLRTSDPGVRGGPSLGYQCTVSPSSTTRPDATIEVTT
jgi:hypothetical protein